MYSLNSFHLTTLKLTWRSARHAFKDKSLCMWDTQQGRAFFFFLLVFLSFWENMFSSKIPGKRKQSSALVCVVGVAYQLDLLTSVQVLCVLLCFVLCCCVCVVCCCVVCCVVVCVLCVVCCVCVCVVVWVWLISLIYSHLFKCCEALEQPRRKSSYLIGI